MKNLFFAIIFFTIIFIVGNCTNKPIEEKIEKEFDFRDGTFSLETIAGSVFIESWTKEKIDIFLNKKSKSQKNLDVVKTQINVENNVATTASGTIGQPNSKITVQVN